MNFLIWEVDDNPIYLFKNDDKSVYGGFFNLFCIHGIFKRREYCVNLGVKNNDKRLRGIESCILRFPECFFICFYKYYELSAMKFKNGM